MKRLFGTDGIRGQANRYPMDALTAYRVGVAIGHYFRTEGSEPRIYIGRDTRASGTMLEGAIGAGICAVGGEAINLGVVSTPGVAHLTHATAADAGIVISASHNPFIDNGIKIFSKDGFKLPDEVEIEIENLVLKGDVADLHVKPHEVGACHQWPEGIEIYQNGLIKSVGDCGLENIKLVIDCANGAATWIAPHVFESLGAQLSVIGDEPDGRNINRGCGSLHMSKLQEAVENFGADIGVAFDGDADRAIFVDSRSQVVDGDRIMAICAKRLMDQGKLANNTLVATVMSNIGLGRAMSEIGVKLKRTSVGDRYVVEEMLRAGDNFGGEQSGHLIFLEHSTSGDGILTALQVLSMLVESGQPLHELASIMTVYPQVLKNLVVAYKRPLEELDFVSEVISRIEEELKDEGRVLVRYSGTESKVRVMVEGPVAQAIDSYADEIISALDSELN